MYERLFTKAGDLCYTSKCGSKYNGTMGIKQVWFKYNGTMGVKLIALISLHTHTHTKGPIAHVFKTRL